MNLVPGLSLRMILLAIAVAVQASVISENLAISVAISTFFRGFRQSIGVEISGVIFQNQMKSNLLVYPALKTLAEKYSGDAASIVQIIQRIENIQVRSNLQQTYTDSLKILWAFYCGVSRVIFVMSIFTECYDLDRVLVTTRDFREENARREENIIAESYQRLT